LGHKIQDRFNGADVFFNSAYPCRKALQIIVISYQCRKVAETLIPLDAEKEAMKLARYHSNGNKS